LFILVLVRPWGLQLIKITLFAALTQITQVNTTLTIPHI